MNEWNRKGGDVVDDSADAGGLEPEDIDGPEAPGVFDCDDHDIADFPGGVPLGVFDCEDHDVAKPSGRASVGLPGRR